MSNTDKHPIADNACKIRITGIHTKQRSKTVFQVGDVVNVIWAREDCFRSKDRSASDYDSIRYSASVYDWEIVDEKPKERAVTAPMIPPVNIPSVEKVVDGVRKELFGSNEFPIDKIMKSFTPKETIRIAYIPTIIGNVCIKYAKALADYCASHQLPYKKEVREIRTSCKDYYAGAIYMVTASTLKKLEEQTDYFFSEAGSDVNTLYWVIRQEIMKNYPNTDYDLPTYAYMYFCLFAYIQKFQATTDAEIKKRTHTSFYFPMDPHLASIKANMEKITSNSRIDRTEMIERACKVIANRIDQLIFSEVHITND